MRISLIVTTVSVEVLLVGTLQILIPRRLRVVLVLSLVKAILLAGVLRIDIVVAWFPEVVASSLALVVLLSIAFSEIVSVV